MINHLKPLTQKPTFGLASFCISAISEPKLSLTVKIKLPQDIDKIVHEIDLLSCSRGPGGGVPG